MFDVSLPWANFLFDISNLLLFLGAFAVAIGTYGSIKMGAIREKFADERISANEAETKRAIADSDVARENAAKANEAAELLRKKNIDMESAVSPRVLEQGLTSQALRSFAGMNFIVVSPPDFEPRRAAGQIRAMLSMAGWKKYTDSLGAQDYPFFDGVVVHTLGMGRKSREAAELLVTILMSNKFVARTGYSISKTNPDGTREMALEMGQEILEVVIIEVGPKPLPESMQLKPEDVPADSHGNRIWGNIEE